MNTIASYLKTILYSPTKDEIISDFWQSHINNFFIYHGTSSLHKKHFETHGIGPEYPEIVRNLLEKTNSVWRNHLRDCPFDSIYFRDSYMRYAKARDEKKTEIYFTANPFRIQEFTRGARKGGEFLRETQHFLQCATQLKSLSEKDAKTLEEIRLLAREIKTSDPMVVKVSAGSDSLSQQLLSERPLFSTHRQFSDYAKEKCPQENIADFSKCLNTTVLEELLLQQKNLREDYEIVVTTPIPPKDLQYDIKEIFE